jgi:spore coat protein U-like protein
MFKSSIKSAAVALSLLAGTSAFAATTTATFTSKIVITAACQVSATNMDFGTQGVLATNIDMTSVITVTCSNGTPYNVLIDQGTMGTGVTARKMKVLAGNSEAVAYSLFRDSSRSLNWGQTIGTDTLAGTGTGTTQAINVYGRVAPQATVSPGTYTDALTVTLSY